MNYHFYITIHVYADDMLVDSVLVLHSKNYGIVGKGIIAPLRKINGKNLYIKNVQDTYKVKELWDLIDFELYGVGSKAEHNNIIDFVHEYNIVEKYLIIYVIRLKIQINQ